MSWTWALAKADGTLADPPPDLADEMTFHSQADAETWIGETWRELLEAGVDAVTLIDSGREVYGPMNLRASES